MSIENKIGRFMRISGPARFFVPVGIILIVFGILLLGFKADRYQQTVGKVISVTESIPQEDQDKQYDVSVSYTVDGKEYKGTFENLPGTFKTGEEIKVFYDPEKPETISNTKSSKFLPPILIGVGVLAVFFGIFRTVKAIKKSKALDESVPKPSSDIDFEAFKTAPGVTEYYFRWDENSLRPGYLIEDADRNVIFEGKMLKNALVGARSFEFTDHTTGNVQQHEVGHTMSQTYNDGFFTMSSSFKFDGENIWDLLHDRGIRLSTGMFSKFPNMTYDVTRNGEAYAKIESTGKYVHEDEEAEHSIIVPIGRRFYRCWTNGNDFETLFLIMFATSETEQAVVE